MLLGCAGAGRGTNTFYSLQNWETVVGSCYFWLEPGQVIVPLDPILTPRFGSALSRCGFALASLLGLTCTFSMMIFFFFFRAFREFGFFYKSTFLMYSTGKSCGVLLVKDGNFRLTQCRLTLVVVNLGFLGSFVASTDVLGILSSALGVLN